MVFFKYGKAEVIRDKNVLYGIIRQKSLSVNEWKLKIMKMQISFKELNFRSAWGTQLVTLLPLAQVAIPGS